MSYSASFLHGARTTFRTYCADWPVISFTRHSVPTPACLYAACATLVCEWCKRQVLRADDFPFVAEWLTASIAIVIFVLSQGIASLSLITTPPTVMFVKELMPTILAYPVVVVLLRYGFGLRTQQMSGFDASLGQEHCHVDARPKTVKENDAIGLFGRWIAAWFCRRFSCTDATFTN